FRSTNFLPGSAISTATVFTACARRDTRSIATPKRSERSMSIHSALSENLALRMLARKGIAVIWELNIAAAEAHRTGHPQSAAALLKLADAAENAWLRAEGARSLP